MNLIAILLALLAGSSIVISRMINAQLASYTTTHQSTFYNFLTGLLSSFLVLLASYYLYSVEMGSSPLMHITVSIPWWAYGGGIIGLIVVSISNVITPKISALVLTLLIFTGQILSGMVIDFFLSGHISTLDLIGTILVIVGLMIHLKLTHQ